MVALRVAQFVVSILVEVNVGPTVIVRIGWLVVFGEDFTGRLCVDGVVLRGLDVQ